MTDIETHPRSTDTLLKASEKSVEAKPSDGTLTTLVTGILDDAQKLVRQQFEMLKAEVHDDIRRTKKAAEYGGIGAVLLTVGSLALVWALANFLNQEFNLQMWVSFLIVGGFFSILGAGLAAVSYGILERMSPLPNKSLHAMEETLQWKTK